MRLLLITLLILHILPLKNANSIYEFSLPELKTAQNHIVQIWRETGVPDPNRTDTRFLFHSSKFGFKNPNFIQNVSDFLLMDNAFSTFNLIADATDDILENSEHFSNFSQKPTLWIIDFQSKDYAKIFPQFEIQQLSCDEFDFYGKNRKLENFEVLLLETNSECGLKIHEGISKNSDFILQSLALKWKFYDIIILETVETTNYTYSPYPEYREELRNLENIKRQRYFQNIYIDKLQEMFRTLSENAFGIEMQLMIRLSNRFAFREDMDRFNVFYALRKLFYFVISNSKIPGFFPQLVPVAVYCIHIFTFLPIQQNRNNVFLQLMILEGIYIAAKYTVDDTRSVIWPFILVNEIFDLFNVFEYRTTEYLAFELQTVKIFSTFYNFILLNQYPQFSVLIWLTVIVTLQLLSFFLYFFFPPLTWTVPILDIAPVFGAKNRYMIYTRYVAAGFVLLIFWALFGGIELNNVMALLFSTIGVAWMFKSVYVFYE